MEALSCSSPHARCKQVALLEVDAIDAAQTATPGPLYLSGVRHGSATTHLM